MKKIISKIRITLLAISILISIVGIVYVLVSNSQFNSLQQEKTRQFTEQEYLVDTIQREIVMLFTNRSLAEWEEHKRNSIMTVDLKTETYGSDYNAVYYNTNRGIRIKNLGYTMEKPYKFLADIEVITQSGTYSKHIEITYQDNYITDLKYY